MQVSVSLVHQCSRFPPPVVVVGTWNGRHYSLSELSGRKYDYPVPNIRLSVDEIELTGFFLSRIWGGATTPRLAPSPAHTHTLAIRVEPWAAISYLHCLIAFSLVASSLVLVVTLSRVFPFPPHPHGQLLAAALFYHYFFFLGGFLFGLLIQ